MPICGRLLAKEYECNYMYISALAYLASFAVDYVSSITAIIEPMNYSLIVSSLNIA